MPRVTVDVLQHSQTGKIHIVQLKLSDLRHCYCSLNRRRNPDTRTIDLQEDNVCETCVKGFIDDCADEKIERLSESSADAAQIREVLGE